MLSKWFGISPAAKGIADAFRTDQLTHCDICGHGISAMSVQWRNHEIHLSWYSGGRPRSLSIDGNPGFPKGADSRHIFRAAWARADQMTSEMLAKLNAATSLNDGSHNGVDASK